MIEVVVVVLVVVVMQTRLLVKGQVGTVSESVAGSKLNEDYSKE